MSANVQAAYEVNGQHVERSLFYQIACDPQRSVVVEACAGAGKTWMLVSRIIRSLLDGIKPQHILAITFTKKAAGEMRERLHAWLTQFAHQTPSQRVQELIMRGLTPDRAAEFEPQLAALHATWLVSGRSVEIHTIHGWFSRLIKVAPLDVLTELKLPPQMSLIEDQSELWPDLWGRFLRKVDQGEGLDAYTSMVKQVGGFSVEGWLQTALSNRLEIELADAAGALDNSVETVAQWSDQWAAWAHPDQALGGGGFVQRMWAVAAVLGAAKGAIAKEAAGKMTDALSHQDLAERGALLKAALLTANGEPKKRMGDSEELAWAQDWLIDWGKARAQQQAYDVQQAMSALTRVLFAEYALLKSERGLADMVDLELAASRLLTDPILAGWIQERLDGQTQQLLMDEFQDTSPLQWQTLRAWLAAYAGAGGGRSGQQPMRVFLVGDPKQSIYRFRRADPRVFDAAKHFIVDGLDGVLLACDHTRRNAPGIIDALNLCLHEAAGQGAFQGYRTHTTESDEPSRVCMLPTVLRSAVDKSPVSDEWRDSLSTPRVTEQVSLKQLEAQQIAVAIAHLIQVDGIPAGEIYVLARKRASLSLVSDALNESGIANMAPENALLAETPEVRDLIAVLDVLVSPHHDLSLAHALKSPLFMAGDEDLILLAKQAAIKQVSWWDALLAMDKTSALARAAALLQAWQLASVVLPPHDLLERLVSESGLRASLASMLGPRRYMAACANVDALLSHSLEMDSGRDATVYRWIRSIKRSTVTLTPKAHGDAVQLLTVHGAKGLEADIVFLMDTDALPGKAESYSLLVDWPEGADRPVRCAFLKSEANPPPSLTALLESEALAADREELNALYVAMTRAKSQLIISRMEPRYQAAKASWWQRLVACGAVDPMAPWCVDQEVVLASAIEHDNKRIQMRHLPKLHPLPELQPKEESEQSPLQLLGKVVHRVLEWITTIPAAQRKSAIVQRTIKQAADELALPAEWRAQADALMATLLSSEELAPWLSPEGHLWAGNEVALQYQGQTWRMDRLVAKRGEQGTEWWVLDYKLNHQPQELDRYQIQMRQYIQAVSAVQGGDVVRAAFITGSGRFVPFSPIE